MQFGDLSKKLVLAREGLYLNQEKKAWALINYKAALTRKGLGHILIDPKE